MFKLLKYVQLLEDLQAQAAAWDVPGKARAAAWALNDFADLAEKYVGPRPVGDAGGRHAEAEEPTEADLAAHEVRLVALQSAPAPAPVAAFGAAPNAVGNPLVVLLPFLIEQGLALIKLIRERRKAD